MRGGCLQAIESAQYFGEVATDVHWIRHGKFQLFIRSDDKDGPNGCAIVWCPTIWQVGFGW